MFSYRHAFHAGNHADVLKHVVTMQLLDYMGQKEAPYMVIDTHAGAGTYALTGGPASKNAEFENGIGRLWDADKLPAPLAQYVEMVRTSNPDHQLRYYPGSPFIAERMMRAQDRLRLFELHPAEGKLLVDNFRRLEEKAAGGRGKRVMIQKEDGFAAMKSLLPPPSRRALVLIDPPYEDKNDYRKVRDAMQEALKRFPTGTYAIWYPVLQRLESRQLPERLKRLPAKDWLNVTLSISRPSPDGFGLSGSGMFILNPPWTLEPLLRQTMPELVRLLGADAGAGFVLESGEPVSLGSRPRTATRSDADLTTRDPRMETESRPAPEGGRTGARVGSKHGPATRVPGEATTRATGAERPPARAGSRPRGRS